MRRATLLRFSPSRRRKLRYTSPPLFTALVGTEPFPMNMILSHRSAVRSNRRAEERVYASRRVAHGSLCLKLLFCRRRAPSCCSTCPAARGRAARMPQGGLPPCPGVWACRPSAWPRGLCYWLRVRGHGLGGDFAVLFDELRPRRRGVVGKNHQRFLSGELGQQALFIRERLQRIKVETHDPRR